MEYAIEITEDKSAFIAGPDGYREGPHYYWQDAAEHIERLNNGQQFSRAYPWNNRS